MTVEDATEGTGRGNVEADDDDDDDDGVDDDVDDVVAIIGTYSLDDCDRGECANMTRRNNTSACSDLKAENQGAEITLCSRRAASVTTSTSTSTEGVAVAVAVDAACVDDDDGMEEAAEEEAAEELAAEEEVRREATSTIPAKASSNAMRSGTRRTSASRSRGEETEGVDEDDEVEEVEEDVEEDVV